MLIAGSYMMEKEFVLFFSYLICIPVVAILFVVGLNIQLN